MLLGPGTTKSGNAKIILTLAKRSPMDCCGEIQKRFKGHIFQHRKPRWAPKAKTKEFILPKRDMTPVEEKEQMDRLKVNYLWHFSALTQYLHEDQIKHSDVGEAAKIEAKREEEEHKRLMEENEAVNKEIQMRRKERIKREMESKKEEIKEEIREAQRMEEERVAKAQEEIRAETEAMQKRIRPDQVEKAIEAALASPVDHEFAIDKEGNIYRGRYTKSVLVPKEQLEKIPVPPNKDDLLGTGRLKQ